MVNKIFMKISSIVNKKYVKNGLWLYALQFFNMVVPLVTLPYITRVLGASRYGTFSTAFNIVTYLQVIVEYGFGMSATRQIALEGKKQLNRVFTTVIVSRMILLLFCGVFSIIYVILNLSHRQLCLSFLILLSCLLGYCIQMNWLFQGMQEMRYISIVNIVGRTLSTVLVFCFVKTIDDLLLYCFLYAISPLVSGMCGFAIAHFKYECHFIRVSFIDVIEELKSGFYVFTTQISSKIFGAIGITFLSIFVSSFSVGVFSAIQKIPAVMILLWTPISQVIYPIVSQKFQDGFGIGYSFAMKMRKGIIPVFVFLTIVIGIFGKPTINILYGSEYSDYFYWIYPLLAWVIISIENNFWGIQILLGSGHDKEYGAVFQIGVIVTVFSNFVLAKFYGGLGAAIAPLISELVLNVLLRVKVRRVYIVSKRME
ncbi:flippase [Ligilactobacillus ruminis]|uniref:flippase n=1 Tax=Ligilactobacillus ruminis TaxID=1623 RepID=UPI0009BBFFDB|nr:flippase [Ligilactobacillus ruminis]WDC80015.1 flippase [Ligilactobacillus ruminis]